ncbi:MAG: response regulator transcription factor [Gammaproteobacteria bacterium]|nr:response regulator transcription factor [Gammaproteobacteria bacterium]
MREVALSLAEAWRFHGGGGLKRDERILIADDEVTSRTLLAEVLRATGHDVVEVTNGDDAWRVLGGGDPPQLAILDWMMPGLDGPEVIRRCRALDHAQAFYLMLLTSKDEKFDVVRGLDAGADDYLTKPFYPGELQARIAVGKRLLAMQYVLAARVHELEQAHAQIKTLRGIVPICASCKKIRDDDGYWHQVENYVRAHSEADFSHSICPGCTRQLYPDFDE